MRREFVDLLYNKMIQNNKIYLLTGDLGYGLFDCIRKDFPDRFYNFGSSEQLMLGAAVGLALENKIPIVYSITPFLLYRPFEFIRNYLDHERIPVKLVGGGRGRDYGSLGFSHWAEDDTKIMSCFDNIKIHIPADNKDLQQVFESFINDKVPVYINLKK